MSDATEAQKRPAEDAESEEAPKPKRIRVPRPKAKRAQGIWVLMCDVHKTLLAALTKHLPGITELEFMDNFRSAFAKFEKPGQAEELAAKTGEFHIAGEPVTTATKNKQGEQKNELFIAMNVKRMLFSIFKAEYEGCVLA